MPPLLLFLLLLLTLSPLSREGRFAWRVNKLRTWKPKIGSPDSLALAEQVAGYQFASVVYDFPQTGCHFGRARASADRERSRRRTSAAAAAAAASCPARAHCQTCICERRASNKDERRATSERVQSASGTSCLLGRARSSLSPARCLSARSPLTADWPPDRHLLRGCAIQTERLRAWPATRAPWSCLHHVGRAPTAEKARKQKLHVDDAPSEQEAALSLSLSRSRFALRKPKESCAVPPESCSNYRLRASRGQSERDKTRAQNSPAHCVRGPRRPVAQLSAF